MTILISSFSPGLISLEPLGTREVICELRVFGGKRENPNVV